MKAVDYLIVGQGIAGTLLSYFLIQSNKKVLVIDNGQNTTSKIAGGIINPVTGRRLVKTWKADTLIPFAKETYLKLENELETKFLKELSILKVFSSVKEQNDWLAKFETEEMQDYMESSPLFVSSQTHSDYEDKIQLPFGYGEIKGGMHVNMSTLLKNYQDYLIKNDAFIEDNYDYNEMIITANGVEWKNIQAKCVIFCEGVSTKQNPYFNWLPFVPAKGEILVVKIPELKMNEMINKGIFILPVGDDLYKVGSTFDWDDLSNDPTDKAKTDLIEKLDDLLKVNYEIIDHKAGVRPTVKDRRPFIGLHPNHPQLGVFNGMGTKGALLAPFFAKHFVDFLENNGVLDKEVCIKRFH
ncbi:MAG: FAD-binding oxidoreductase [Bacteroidia bacterium]|nr:FAD-binding oxidoreductase [Bacteroidia bacterium]